jgi:hypothetical protein
VSHAKLNHTLGRSPYTATGDDPADFQLAQVEQETPAASPALNQTTHGRAVAGSTFEKAEKRG